MHARRRPGYGVKSGCDSSENGFPKKLTATDKTVFLFLVPNPSAVRRQSTALACVGSFGKEKRWSRVDPAPARRVQAIITRDCGILLEGSLTVEAKKAKKKKKAKTSYGLQLSYLYIEHKAVERKNDEVLRDRSLFTPDTNHGNERQ